MSVLIFLTPPRGHETRYGPVKLASALINIYEPGHTSDQFPRTNIKAKFCLTNAPTRTNSINGNLKSQLLLLKNHKHGMLVDYYSKTSKISSQIHNLALMRSQGKIEIYDST